MRVSNVVQANQIFHQFINPMFKCVSVLLLLQLSLSFLQVYGPSCAVNRLPNNIEYTLSNFGEILYGETILGQIRLPNDPQLCKTQGEPVTIKKPQSNTKDILLVKRGSCKFTQKVIQAQNLGADVIIIYDHLQGSTPSVIMKNDGHGHLAEIPSLFISNDDGLKLLATSKDCPQLPIVKIQFQLDQKEKSQVTLWLDASNRETFILARDFYKNEYFEAIKDRIEFSVRFRIENTCDDWICSKNDCIYASLLGQKYCRNSVKSDNPQITTPKGVDIIYEQLREYFLWQQLKESEQKLKWWKYMTQFDHEVCIEAADIADCSYSAMKTVQVSEKVIKNIKNSIDLTIAYLKDNKDNILKQSYNQAKELAIYFYPEATINNRNFYGLFKAPEVFEAICSSLIDPPKSCITFIKQNHKIVMQDEDSSIWKVIAIILALMALGFLIALFLYTRIVRKEVNQQLSVEVNKMVESYVTMSNKKGTGSSYSKFES